MKRLKPLMTVARTAASNIDLSQDELGAVAAGVATLPEPVIAACGVILDD
jgi:hypothetical protein